MDNSYLPTTILQIKLIPPSFYPENIHRTRLQELVLAAGNLPISIISAPAGSGKTACLVEVAQNNPQNTAWYSLEDSDNEPIRFWRYFHFALEQILPGIVPDISIALSKNRIGFIPGEIDLLCNCFLKTVQTITLVLDDFQVIHHPDILKGILYLVEHQPKNFHLVLSTRVTPALPLSRWRVKGILAEIKSKDLAFTQEEAETLFKRDKKCCLDAHQMKYIMEYSRGWAAGLRLIEYALREQTDEPAIWNVGRRLTTDYLTHEILTDLPPDWLDFIQQVAIFDQFTLEMARFLSNQPATENLIGQLLDANLFIQKKDEIWQFQPFFREAILARLSPDVSRKLHQRAATWFKEHHWPEKAISHALAGEDWQLAAPLIIQNAGTMLQNGELQTLAGWVQAMPEEQSIKVQDLQVIKAWVLYMQGNNIESMQIIENIQQTVDLDQLSLKEWWYGLRCQFALLSENNQQALEFAENALSMVGNANPFIRGILQFSLASALQALGRSEEAVKGFRDAIKTNRETGHVFTNLFSLAGLGMELNEQGQRLQAMDLCQQALEEGCVLMGVYPPMYGLIFLLLARLQWEANALIDASRSLEQAEMLLGSLGITGFLISADLIHAQILIASDAYGEALNLIQQNRRRIRSEEFTGFRQVFDMLKAEIYLKMGDHRYVETWLEEAELPADLGEDPAREMEFVLKARYLIEKGLWPEAESLLNVIILYAQNTHHIRVHIAALLLRASLLWKKADIGRVNHCLEEALVLATPQRYFRILLEYGAPLSGLLVQLPAASAEIRSLFGFQGVQISSQLVEMLTRREMEVLRLLAENQTNAEIAQTLVVSNETIKVHLKHIFQKLGVENRRQAVRQAYKLNLF
ncbi:MAG: hypothetical protein GYA15_11925 [Leptolinea sp.]|nr:hypothetical protein [Leptolinea sp.]